MQDESQSATRAREFTLPQQVSVLLPSTFLKRPLTGSAYLAAPVCTCASRVHGTTHHYCDDGNRSAELYLCEKERVGSGALIQTFHSLICASLACWISVATDVC